MAQYYTLDEAAKKLGIANDEFRKRLATEWKQVRKFPDGATIRFQSRQIDELARELGRNSDPELQIGEAPLTLAEEPAPSLAGKKDGDKTDAAIFLHDPSSDDFVPLSLDDHVVISTEKKGKTGSDSDVKLESAGSNVHRVSGGDEVTEEMHVDGPAKPKETFQIKSDSPKKPPKTMHVASEFDLSLDANDSDDFDLQLNDDDVADIGTLSRGKKRAGESGINLRDPADSGISLEKDSSEFELQLDSEPPPPAKKSPSTGKMKPPPMPEPDSEFELSLEDPGSDPNATAFDSGDQKDIFETDFELPALDDSSSEKTDGDESNSDFDISIDDDAMGEDSASEVVAIEEEDIEDIQPLEDEDARPVRAVAAAPVEWGVFPVAFLAPCALVMFFVGLMGLELLHSMWGYHSQAKPTGTIVRLIAEQLGEFPKD